MKNIMTKKDITLSKNKKMIIEMKNYYTKGKQNLMEVKLMKCSKVH